MFVCVFPQLSLRHLNTRAVRHGSTIQHDIILRSIEWKKMNTVNESKESAQSVGKHLDYIQVTKLSPFNKYWILYFIARNVNNIESFKFIDISLEFFFGFSYSIVKHPISTFCMNDNLWCRSMIVMHWNIFGKYCFLNWKKRGTFFVI